MRPRSAGRINEGVVGGGLKATIKLTCALPPPMTASCVGAKVLRGSRGNRLSGFCSAVVGRGGEVVRRVEWSRGWGTAYMHVPARCFKGGFAAARRPTGPSLGPLAAAASPRRRSAQWAPERHIEETSAAQMEEDSDDRTLQRPLGKQALAATTCSAVASRRAWCAANRRTPGWAAAARAPRRAPSAVRHGHADPRPAPSPAECLGCPSPG